MYKKAVLMKVYPNMHEEYEKRHKEIWPEMVRGLEKHGVKSYSIYLDETTSLLFGYLEVEDLELWDKFSSTEINQKWWRYMEPVMETNEDSSPVTKELKAVFSLEN